MSYRRSRRRQGVFVKACWLALAVSRIAAAAESSATGIAGWAQAEITPPLGIALGGRGGPDTVADKVLDPLFAHVLWLRDAKGTGFALVSLDVIGLPHALSHRLRTALVQELGADFNLVLINCSHTHSGPYLLRDLMAGAGPAPEIEKDYFNTLAEKVVSAARVAARNPKPVTVETSRGTSSVAINRRAKGPDGKVAGLRPDAGGVINAEVWVLKLAPTDGSKSALVFSYACHPVIVYGYANSAISADFPGVTRNILREKLGAAHAQFVQGTAGNVRPRILADLEQGRFRIGTPEVLRQAGAELATNVVEALQGQGQPLTLDLAGTADRPFLPRGNPPARTVYEKMAKETEKASRRDAAEYWLKRYDAGQGFARGDAWPLGLVRLAANEWICHFAGEPCAEWPPKVWAWLGRRNVVVWGYTQESSAYLPTEALLAEGGYEVEESNFTRAHSPSPLAPGIEDAVRRSLRRQLAFLEADAGR